MTFFKTVDILYLTKRGKDHEDHQHHRPPRYDKNTWARVDGDKLTVNIGKGYMSSGYLEELEAFLAPYNLKITTGRVTVAM